MTVVSLLGKTSLTSGAGLAATFEERGIEVPALVVAPRRKPISFAGAEVMPVLFGPFPSRVPAMLMRLLVVDYFVLHERLQTVAGRRADEQPESGLCRGRSDRVVDGSPGDGFDAR